MRLCCGPAAEHRCHYQNPHGSELRPEIQNHKTRTEAAPWPTGLPPFTLQVELKLRSGQTVEGVTPRPLAKRNGMYKSQNPNNPEVYGLPHHQQKKRGPKPENPDLQVQPYAYQYMYNNPTTTHRAPHNPKNERQGSATPIYTGP